MEEYNITQRINSKFIVHILEAFNDETAYYFVMDLMKDNLRKECSKRGGHGDIKTKFMIACIIQSLEDIHAARIVHRDMKPANMLWDANGYIHITDFGLASETKTGSHNKSSGTIRFMAPEVLFREGHTYQSDFYAIGILLYYFLMKKYPYNSQVRAELK